MRLPRPYIPLRVRVQVAERQWKERFGPATNRVWAYFNGDKPYSDSRRLKILLDHLFGPKVKVELHHRPALVNRVVKDHYGLKSYVPPANDPDYLVYLPAADHDIETRVRGQHGQHSDLALARKRKRKEKKLAALLIRKGPWGNLKQAAKRKWPKRKMESRRHEARNKRNRTAF